MISKPIWKSKIFWFNILSIALEVLDVLPIPTGTAVILVNLINIALRWVTKYPVNLS
jgi:hypothetical protein